MSKPKHAHSSKSAKEISRLYDEIKELKPLDQMAELTGKNVSTISGYHTGRKDIPIMYANWLLLISLLRKLTDPETFRFIINQLERHERATKS